MQRTPKSVLSSVEFVTHLKHNRYEWRAIFHTFANLFLSRLVYIYIYIIHVIMNTMCPPGYHHNGFVATHALEHMMYSEPYTWAHDVRWTWYMMNRTSCAQVHELPQSHCGDNQEGTLVFMTACILCSSCFCEIWALCVSWITYDHLYIFYT